MPTPPMTDEECLQALEVRRQYETVQAAADAIGKNWHWLARRVREAERRKLATDTRRMVEMPTFVLEGDEEEPIEKIIDRMARNFERAKKAQDARKWFPIAIKDSKPIGVLFVGDPHVDDNGCAWPILRKHIDIAKNTEGMFAVNIGDVGNDWGGRPRRVHPPSCC
jgi:hypothetical protein